MKTLYIRVAPRQGERFYRCGTEFTREWRALEVDDATAQRLEEEQMLEVSAAPPADLEAIEIDAPADDAHTPPDHPATRRAVIVEAIRQLFGAGRADDFTQGGLPKTGAIETLTGWAVAAAERDEAWADFTAERVD